MSGKLLLILSIASIAASGCTQVVVPEVVPFRPAGYQVWPADFNGDGTSEFIETYSPGLLAGHLAVTFTDELGLATHQTGIVGDLTMPIRVRRPDRREWVVLPYRRNDSLFATVVDVMNLDEVTVPIASGTPRKVEGGVFPWDPRLNHVEIEDFDLDGDDDLLTLVNTGYARHPRGFFLHDLASGRLLDSLMIDAATNESVRGFVSRDGSHRWLLGSSGSDNGAANGRLDDLHSYVFVVEYTDSLRLIADRRMGGLFTNSDLLSDAPIQHEYDPVTAVTTRGEETGEPSYAVKLQPVTLAPFVRYDFPARVIMAIAPRWSETAEGAIVALTAENELLRIHASLEPASLTRAPAPRNPRSVVALDDVDNDGTRDFAVGIPEGYDVYGSDLEFLAHVLLPNSPDAELTALTRNHKPDGRYLVTRSDAMSYLLSFRSEVRLYPWARTGLLFLIVSGLLLGLVALVHRQTTRIVTQRLQSELDTRSAAVGKLAIRVDLPNEPHGAAADLVIRISAALDRSALNRETSVTGLAEELGMSQRHLQRTCESLFGLSPHDLLTRRRVLHAAGRLTTTTDLVKEIAFDSGFSSSAQLETAFKKHFDVPPTEYRATRRIDRE